MSGSHWRLVASLIRPHRRAFVGFGLLLAVGTGLPIAASFLLARFVDLAVARAGVGRLTPLGLGYAGLGLAASLITIVVSWRARVLAWRLTNGLRRELAGHVLYADLSFHRDRTPGELLTRCDADVTSLTTFLSSVVARVVGIGLLVVVSVAVVAVAEPILAAPMALGYGSLIWVGWKMKDTSAEAVVAERAIDAEMNGIIEQYLAGAEDVAALGAGRHGVRRFGEAAARSVVAARTRVGAEMRLQASIRSTIVATELAVLVVGAIAFARGAMAIGGVVLGFRLVDAVRQQVEHLVWRLQEAQGVSGAARRVVELVEDGRRMESGTAPLPAGPLDVRFEEVGLVYDDATDGEQALSGLDLEVQAGRVVGLVGRSGSGKTSAARLALRLVHPTAGAVRMGGIDLRVVEEEVLRQRVGAIPQDVQLFPGSVRDNVTMFASAEDDEVIAALRDAGLGPWVDELPEGLDTRLAADGRTDGSERTGLSAGQAQLLAIARALLHRPDVVVLDEATSRVDPATQAAISDALGRLVGGRTGIVIAHRLETLDICDDIAVLADGRLVEFGERGVLAADPLSRYARLRAVGADAEELA